MRGVNQGYPSVEQHKSKWCMINLYMDLPSGALCLYALAQEPDAEPDDAGYPQ